MYSPMPDMQHANIWLQYLLLLCVLRECRWAGPLFHTPTSNLKRKSHLTHTHIFTYQCLCCDNISTYIYGGDNLRNQKIGVQHDKQCTLSHFLDYGSQFRKLYWRFTFWNRTVQNKYYFLNSNLFNQKLQRNEFWYKQKQQWSVSPK